MVTVSEFLIFCYTGRQNMREKKAMLLCLTASPTSYWLHHIHCHLQQTASHTGASCEVKSSPSLCHRSINDIPSKQSGSFFPCLNSE